jgi:hypothetical protein
MSNEYFPVKSKGDSITVPRIFYSSDEATRCSEPSKMNSGSPSPAITDSSSTTLSTSSMDGRSYMGSSSICSRMERSPRAPVFRSIALRATARRASSRISSSHPSISNIFMYCLVRAFLGSVRICTRASSSSSCKVAMTGRRPTNSGINP